MLPRRRRWSDGWADRDDVAPGLVVEPVRRNADPVDRVRRRIAIDERVIARGDECLGAKVAAVAPASLADHLGEAEREGAPVHAVEGAGTRGGVSPPKDVGVTDAADGERDDVRVRRDA